MTGQIVISVLIALGALACASYALIASRDQRIAERNLLISNAVGDVAQAPEDVPENPDRGPLGLRLHAAGMESSPLVWLATVIGVAFIAYAVASVFTGNALVSLALAASVLIGQHFYVSSKIKKRKLLLEEQFGHACAQLAGSLRTGLGIERAIRSVAGFVDEPLKSEFVRVSLETRRDPDVAEALRRMAERTGCKDVEFLASTIEVNQRRGGRLAEIVERLAQTVAKRQEMRRLIRSESSSGRSGAKAVTIITLLLIAFQFTVNPTYIEFYTKEPLGWAVAGISAALFLLGCYLMHRYTDIDCD